MIFLRAKNQRGISPEARRARPNSPHSIHQSFCRFARRGNLKQVPRRQFNRTHITWHLYYLYDMYIIWRVFGGGVRRNGPKHITEI